MQTMWLVRVVPVLCLTQLTCYGSVWCVGSKSITQLMDLFVLCVACFTVNCELFGENFAMCLGVVAILLLNVMNVFSVGGGALLDRPCMVFQRMCVLCL